MLTQSALLNLSLCHPHTLPPPLTASKTAKSIKTGPRKLETLDTLLFSIDTARYYRARKYTLDIFKFQTAPALPAAVKRPSVQQSRPRFHNRTTRRLGGLLLTPHNHS